MFNAGSIAKEGTFHITRLKVINFKSISELDVSLQKLNVIIGRNATGKSNFIDVFRFLKDCLSKGVTQAVQLHSGVSGVKSVNSKYNFTEIELIGDLPFVISEESNRYRLKKFRYIIRIRHLKKGVKISKEELEITYHKVKEESKSRITKFRRNSKGEINVISRSSFSTTFAQTLTLPNDVTIFQVPTDMVLLSIRVLLEYQISIFDIDSKRLKSISPFNKSSTLDEDASNLPGVLQTILSDKEQRKKLLNNLTYLLDYVSDIDVIPVLGGSLTIGIIEKYNPNLFIHAQSLSEGTLNIIALVVALKFQSANIIILEEPERFIHPSLLQRLMTLILEECRNKQIIITTHSPELVSQTPESFIYLVDRTNNGNTTICNPKDSEIIQGFIDAGLQIGELMADDFL